MNKIEESSLRDFGKDSNTLEHLKNIELSDKIRNNIWNNIESEINPKKNNIYTLFMNYKYNLAIAVAVIISFTAILIYTNNNNMNKIISKNIINIKMGGTITVAKKTSFSVIKSTYKEELVSLKGGELNIHVIPAKKGEPTKKFTVKTKDGIVRVKGTKFNVNVNESGTDVLVRKGTVWVEPNGKGRERVILTKGLSTHIIPLNIFLKEIKEKGTQAYINHEYDIAKEALNKYILNKENDYSTITILARIAESEKRYKDAIILYNKVLKSDVPLEQETAWIAIAVLFKNSNQKIKAKSMFNDYLKKFPNGIFKDDVHKELNKK